MFEKKSVVDNNVGKGMSGGEMETTEKGVCYCEFLIALSENK